MKIAIEAQRVFRPKKHGMDFVALELIRNLQKIDKNNEYFVFVNPDIDRCLISSENLNVIELEGGSYPVWEQRALPAAVRKYGCDILHCTSNTAPVKLSVPLIVTIHDIIYLESLSLLKKGGSLYQKFGNLYRRWNVPKIARKAKFITTVSGFEKETISKRFPDLGDKIFSVYNGVSEHFNPVAESKRRKEVLNKYDLPENFIFYLGNTDPKKNTPNVLKAYDLYQKSEKNPLPLVMIDLGKSYFQKLLSAINSPSLKDHIIVTPYISNLDLPALYSSSNLFLYPSLRESFGIPILEAMSCGTPVITSNTSSMPEVAGDAALIVDPYSPEDIYSKMKTLLSDPRLAKKLVEDGKNQAKKFSWIRMAEEMLDLYKKMILS